MCKNSKLRVYKDLKDDFECKKYLHGVSDVYSKFLFRFRSGTHVDTALGTVVKLVFFCECKSAKTCLMGMLRV